MYGAAVTGRPVRFGNRVAVRTIGDLGFLIDEAESMTGQAGREFVALLADGEATYRIRRRAAGFEASRSGGETQNRVSFILSAEEFLASPIGQAMSAGRLFCRPIA